MKKKLILILMCFLCLLGGCKSNSKKLDDVKIVYINTGRSDSILLMIEGRNYLIDTGTKKSVDAISRVLDKYEITSLDGVFLTHTHSDHIGGLKKLSKSYDISTIYSAQISMNSDDGTNSIDTLIEECELEQVKLNANDTVKVTDSIELNVLGPVEYNSEDDNDNSLVLSLTVNNKTFLFTGDMQFAEETTLLNVGANLSADVLKVANHGNKDATSKEFASKVNPSISIITTNTNDDNNSANKLVINHLGDSKIYVTEDYDYGILITFDSSGKLVLSEAK